MCVDRGAGGLSQLHVCGQRGRAKCRCVDRGAGELGRVQVCRHGKGGRVKYGCLDRVAGPNTGVWAEPIKCMWTGGLVQVQVCGQNAGPSTYVWTGGQVG